MTYFPILYKNNEIDFKDDKSGKLHPNHCSLKNNLKILHNGIFSNCRVFKLHHVFCMYVYNL